ncbi:Uncharacterized protein At4g04980 [Linum perenne]
MSNTFQLEEEIKRGDQQDDDDEEGEDNDDDDIVVETPESNDHFCNWSAFHIRKAALHLRDFLGNLARNRPQASTMPTGTLCGLKPFLLGRKAYRDEGGRERSSSKREKYPVPRPKQMGRSRGGSTELFILMMDLRKKIIIFRDVFDLPPCDFSASINELVTETMTDLHNLHPEIMPMKELSDIKEEASIHEVLIYLCGALRSVGDSWVKSHEWMDKSTLYKQDNKDELNSEQLVELALATLNCLIKVAKEKSEEDDEDEDDDDEAEEEEEYMKHGVEKAKFLVRSYSESNATPFSTSPETPTSVLPGLKCPASPKAEEFTNLYCSSPLLRFLSVEAVGKLNRIDIKRLSFHLFPHHHGNQKSNVVNEDKMEESNKDEDDRDGRKDNEATSLVPPPPPPPPPSTPPPPPVLKTEEATISLSVLLSPPKTLLSEIPSASPPPPPMPPPPRNVSQGKEQPSSSMTTPKTAKQATPPSLVSSSNGPAAPPPPPPAPSSNGPTPPPPPPGLSSNGHVPPGSDIMLRTIASQ